MLIKQYSTEAAKNIVGLHYFAANSYYFAVAETWDIWNKVRRLRENKAFCERLESVTINENSFWVEWRRAGNSGGSYGLLQLVKLNSLHNKLYVYENWNLFNGSFNRTVEGRQHHWIGCPIVAESSTLRLILPIIRNHFNEHNYELFEAILRAAPVSADGEISLFMMQTQYSSIQKEQRYLPSGSLLTGTLRNENTR